MPKIKAAELSVRKPFTRGPSKQSIPSAPKSIPNPCKPKTNKHAAFEIVRAGGPRNQIVAAIRQTGVTHHTANTWLSIFRRHIAKEQQR